MSKIRLLSIAVIGLLILNLALLSFLLLRKPPFPPGGALMPGEGPRNIIIERLQFDDEQVASYEKLIRQHQDAIRLLNDSIRTAKNQLYGSLKDEHSAIKDSLIARLGQLQEKIEWTHYNHFEDIRKICKPGQLKNFNDLTKDLARFFAMGKKDGPPPRD